MLESISKSNILTRDEKHIYRLNDKRVPGVTTINHNGYPISQGLLRWKIKMGIVEHETGAIAKKAADIGTVVHDYAYLVETKQSTKAAELLDDAKTFPDADKILKAIDALREFWTKVEDEVLLSEEMIASVKFKFGGTVDRVSKRNGAYVLSDFKTSSSFYLSQFLQLAAYRLALKEWKGIDATTLEILRFGKDGTFESRQVTDKTFLKALEQQFIRNLKTYNFRKKYKDN